MKKDEHLVLKHSLIRDTLRREKILPKEAFENHVRNQQVKRLYFLSAWLESTNKK